MRIDRDSQQSLTAGWLFSPARAKREAPQASRRKVVLWTFAVVAVLAVAQLVRLQLWKHEDFISQTESIHIKSLKVPARRGEIRDCRGRGLAVTERGMSLEALPHGLNAKEKREAVDKLRQVGGIPEDKIREAFQGEPAQVFLSRFCSDEMLREVKRLRIPGVREVIDHKRHYTSAWSSNINGFVNANNIGLEGMEYYCNDTLAGIDGLLVFDPYVKWHGTPLPRDGSRAPVHGNNVILTIDNTIQFILFSHLEEVCREYDADQALGIIMDPRSGAILAMATCPSYSSAHYGEFDPSRFRPRCVTDLYEPGSLFKVFVVAAALNVGAIRPDEVFDCHNGSLRVGRSIIRDWKAFGELSVEDILVNSSNIGMSQISSRLTAQLLHTYLSLFGFLEKPGLGLFAEPAPGIEPCSRWSEEYISFTSFGQGVSFTALSIITALSAIANDGIMMRPFIVQAVEDPEGNIIHYTKPTVSCKRPIERETAQTVKRMMRKVVEGGSGHAAAVPGIVVCGKTGTAQIFDDEAQCYSHEDLITSFMGFAPAENPEICMLVSVFKPTHAKREVWGSTVAAPVFSAVAKHVLAYLQARKTPPLATASRRQERGGARVEVG